MNPALERQLDLRRERASIASQQARRKAPSGIVVLASVLFFVSLGALLLAANSRRQAIEGLGIEAETLAQVQRRAATIAELRAKAALKTDDRTYLPRQAVTLQIQNAAAPDLRGSLGTFREQPGALKEPGAELRRFIYTNVQHVSAETLLEWVQAATDRVPGLIVERIKLTPQPQHWRMEVEFAGWEKKE